MWKINLLMVVLLFGFLYAMYATTPASQLYWESVGPTWDQLLNPNKYSKQE